MKTALVGLGIAMVVVCLGAGILNAQTAVTLTPTTAPTAGQAGVTVINLTGSAFPAGTIPPANTDVWLEPAAGGAAVTTKATAVTTITGTTRRVTFQVPASINVAVPTAYLVSVSGTTSTGVAFASSNKSALTINPPAQISLLSPNTGQPGETLTVSITGQFTTFTQGSTRANLGPGISVGNAAEGALGPITVTSVTTATAQLQINAAATPGPRNVVVQTGVQQALLTNGFTVVAPRITASLPSSGTQGQTLSVAITGQDTHFVQGTTQLSFGAGVNVSGVTVANSTSISTQISIASNAALGFRTLTVTTGAEAVTLNNALNVLSGPTITTSVDRPPNQAGWYNADVTVTFTCTAPSGIAGCPPPRVVSTEGASQLVSGTFVSAGISVTASTSISLDKTPPGATTTRSPLANAQGWNSTNVTIAFNGTDGLSGIASCSQPVTLNTDGANQSVSGTCTDNAGNLSQPSSASGINIDKTPPMLTFVAAVPAPNAAGWNNTDVVFPFSTADNLSGISSTSLPSPLSLTTQGISVNGSVTVTDVAGNSAAFTSPSVQIDKTPPAIAITSPPDGSAVHLGLLSVTGTATDIFSGLAAINCNGIPAVQLQSPFSCNVTLNSGTNPIAVTATDQAGNSTSTSETVSYVPNQAPTVSAGGNQTITLPNSATLDGIVTDDGLPVGGTLTITWSKLSGPGAVVFSTASTASTTATFGAAGLYVLRLEASDSLSSGGSNVTITVNSVPVPAILSLNPNTGQQGRQNLPVVVTGQFTKWVQGTTTASFGVGVTVVSLTVGSFTSATAVLNIDPTAAIGGRTITLQTGNEVDSLTNGFIVTVGTPLLTQVNPSGGTQGQQNLSVMLTGQFTHFVQGTSQVGFGPGITVVSLSVNSPTGATAVLNIDPAAALGARTVTLITGTEAVTLSNGFTVSASTPFVFSVSPNSGVQGQQNVSVTFTGQSSHFLQGTSQANFGDGISVTSMTVNSPTSATAILNIDAAAATGGRTVGFTTGSEVGTLNNGFAVTAGTPTLSVHPSSGQQGQQNLPVVITGQFTHFLQGTSQASFGAGITVASLTVNSPTSGTAVLNIDPAAVAGARTITVTTGAETASLGNGFTVKASAPILLSATPYSAEQGQQSLPVVITGQFTHFLQGASQVSFGVGITVTSLTVNSPTSAAAILNIDYSAVAGPRTVTLTTGAEVAVLSNGFTVTSSPPMLLTVTPNSGQQGQQNLSVTVTGQYTHFLQGTSQVSFGPGITVVALTVNSFTSATAVLNIDSAAATGLRSVAVTTGVETVTLANAFTVTSPSVGITVTPSPLGFGGVPITTSSTKTVTITSVGSGALTVTSINGAGAFFTLKNLPSLPLVIAPSGATSFDVTFTPLGTISSNAAVTILSDAASSPTVLQISGTGTPPPLPPVAAVTVTTDQPTYRRAQPVHISGTVTAAGGTGISNIPVTLQVSINGSTRTFNPFTDAQGNYQATFQPAATDGGTFSVKAIATSGGATQTATATFRIFGLLVSPSSVSLNLLMGTSAAVPLDLRNVGDATLNGVNYSATITPTGSLTVSFPQSGSTLSAGELLTVPVTLTAPAGNPPPTPVSVQVTITVTDSNSGATDTETGFFAITLRPNVSSLVLTPLSLSVGVNPGTSLTRRFAVTNKGYAPSSDSTVTLQDPVTFNWVTLGNAHLGNITAGTSQEFQVLINPPANLALGNYTVVFNVSGGTNSLQGTVNISVTQSTLGAASFVVSDDTGAKVGGATVTLVGKTNGKVYQGITATDGKDAITGIDAGDYTYVVTAASHDPGTGSLTVTANATTDVAVLLVYNVVNLTFTVVPTTIPDQYTVTLNITYSTTLPKPALKVMPYALKFSFFPSDVPNGRYPCSLSVTNTHPTAFVRNISVDASQLDLNQPNGQRIHVQFTDGSAVYQVGTLPGKGTTTLACYATLDGDNVPTHDAGNIVVQGNYDFPLDGQILEGTTTTKVPVSYTRPAELAYGPIHLTYDKTDPANPVLTYGGGSFAYTITSQRNQVLNLLKPSGSPFGGHNLAAFTQTVGGLTSLDVINGNQNNVFWQTDFSSLKQSLLGAGDTSTYDISTLDDGLTLVQALNSQIAANPDRILKNPTYLGFEGKWADRAAPTGYLIPVQITTLNSSGDIDVPFPFQGSNQPIPGGLGCLNPEDPGCQEPEPNIPTIPNRDGQIVIAIDQKIRLERQAFNATLGIGAQAVLNNSFASIQILDASGNDASGKFFVLVTSDALGATHGGTISGQTTVGWQLIPNADAGGISPQGTPYKVKATLSYSVNGVMKTATTQVVSITVLPSPKLTIAYTAPFVVMAGKDAVIRVTVQNIGYGTAHNFSIQSAQPRIVETTNPNLFVNFNITASSNTADDSGLQPNNLTINFGDIPPGGTVSGFWIVRVSRNGFFIDFTSTFKHQDYQGIQLDPLVLPPTTTLIPAIGGKVTSDTGQTLTDLTVSVSQNGNIIGSDQTDGLGVYYIPDLAAGFYVEQVTDVFGNVRATKNIGVLGDQGTSLINFVIANFNPVPVTITSVPSGQSFTLAGNSYITPQTLQLFSGSNYTITFGNSIQQGPGARYGFTSWSDGPTANPRTITVGTSAASYNANFGLGYLLSLSASPSIGGNLIANPPSSDGYYSPGTQVQLTATPATGHRFISFSGAISGSTTPQTLTVNAPANVDADFTAPVLILSKHIEPNAFPANTPTMVQFTARITSVRTVIPGSVNLISTTATGVPLSILGQLQPVSIQPDGSYGDYSLSIPVNEATAKTLYFEISVAARGLLQRVVSAPLPVIIYVPPSTSDITLAESAFSNAAAQFSQLRATAGDAAALSQVSLSLQQNPNVKLVQLSPDGFTLRVNFNIGTIAAITADYPPDFVPASGPLISPGKTSAGNAVKFDQALFQAQQNAASTAGNGSIIVLAPQYSSWNPRGGDPSDAIYNGFASLPPGRIPPPVYLKDSAVTVAALKTLKQYGVISITSHGAYVPGVGSVILTGEAMSGPGQINYAADIQAGRVIWLNNPDAPGNYFYAITPAFIEYYGTPGFPESIVYLNSCRSAYSSPLVGDKTLADAFLNSGAGRVFGHTQNATAHFGLSVGQQLFSVLSDSRLAPDERTTAEAFASVPQTTDFISLLFHGAPANTIVALGALDPAVLFNPSLTINKTGLGKGTVTSSSTPPIDCGNTCDGVFPFNTTVTLNAMPDLGMKFNGWGLDCSSSDPTNRFVTIDLTEDRTCTATFVAAVKISLVPFGYLDFSVAPGPHRVQVVAADGITPIAAPQAITVNLTKEVTSVCNVFLKNLTVVIPAGSQTGDLDFVAGMGWCNGAYQPTGTKWIINSVFMGSGITRLPTVAGQTILKIFRTSIPAPPPPTLEITRVWSNQGGITLPDAASNYLPDGSGKVSNYLLVGSTLGRLDVGVQIRVENARTPGTLFVALRDLSDMSIVPGSSSAVPLSDGLYNRNLSIGGTTFAFVHNYSVVTGIDANLNHVLDLSEVSSQYGSADSRYIKFIPALVSGEALTGLLGVAGTAMTVTAGTSIAARNLLAFLLGTAPVGALPGYNTDLPVPDDLDGIVDLSHHVGASFDRQGIARVPEYVFPADSLQATKVRDFIVFKRHLQDAIFHFEGGLPQGNQEIQDFFRSNPTATIHTFTIQIPQWSQELSDTSGCLFGITFYCDVQQAYGNVAFRNVAIETTILRSGSRLTASTIRVVDRDTATPAVLLDLYDFDFGGREALAQLAAKVQTAYSGPGTAGGVFRSRVLLAGDIFDSTFDFPLIFLGQPGQ